MGEWRNGRRGGLMPRASKLSAPGETPGVERLKFGGGCTGNGMLAPSQALGLPREGVETRRGAPETDNAVGEGMVQTTNSQSAGWRRKPWWQEKPLAERS